MDRQKTSVFSDYDPMENSSLNSKQLQNWLKQQSSSINSPKFGAEWTLMMSHSQNVSSRYEPEQVSFAKHHTYESIGDQNNSYLSNTHKTSNSKNKSYVNAMQALQKRVKSLQSENDMMKRSLTRINEQKSRSMSESFAIQEELRCRLQILEPKTQKLDELISQNKKLRQTKEEKVRRVKVLEKSNQDHKNKYEEILNQMQKVKIQNTTLKSQIQAQHQKVKEFEKELERMFEKNQILQEMKEKSTTSLFQKYNKSVEFIQQLERQNGKLKNEIEYIKKNYELKIKEIQNNFQNQIQNYRIQFTKLKENSQKQSQEIQIKVKEKQYFKQAYEKRDEEFVLLVKSQHKKEQKQEKEKSSNQKKAKIERQKEKQRSIERQAEHKSEIIQLPQSLIPANKLKVLDESQQSEMELDLNESMIPKETKSVGKPMKPSNKKSHHVSSSNKRKVPKKQDTTSLNTQEKKKSKKQNNIHDSGSAKGSGNSSVVMKSCEPAISQEPYILLESGQNPVKNSYYYTAYPPIHNKNYSFSNYQEQKGVQEFCSHKNDNSRNLDKMMLYEVQNELLNLYNEEQNLIMASNDEHTSQNERAEYLGRLKQIHEQIRVKNEKACDLKARV